jgi:hypothetical protein
MAAFTFRGIQFREAGEYASPRPSISGANARLRAEYLVNWSDHKNAEIALLGTCSFNSQFNNLGQTQGYINRTTPHPHPTYPWLYASEVNEVRGEATPLAKDADNVAAYSDARIIVTYSALRYDVYEDGEVMVNGIINEGSLKRFVYREAAKCKEKMITYKKGYWIFTDNRRPVQSDIGRAWIVQDLSWVWVQVPFPNVPRTYISQNGGYVNTSDFDGYAAGTLLLRAPGYEMDRMADGKRTCNVHINATFNPLGWNYFPDQARNFDFKQVSGTRVGFETTNCPYPQIVDFSKLFVPSVTG